MLDTSFHTSFEQMDTVTSRFLVIIILIILNLFVYLMWLN